MVYEQQFQKYAQLSKLPYRMGEEVNQSQPVEYIKWENLTALQAKGLIGKLKTRRPAISNILPGVGGKKQEVTYNTTIVSRSIIERIGDLYSITVSAHSRPPKATKALPRDYLR